MTQEDYHIEFLPYSLYNTQPSFCKNQLIEKFNLDINEFYFLAYTNNKQAITIIDLNWSVSYEMDEWDLVESIDDKYIELDEAKREKKNNKTVIKTKDRVFIFLPNR